MVVIECIEIGDFSHFLWVTLSSGRFIAGLPLLCGKGNAFIFKIKKQARFPYWRIPIIFKQTNFYQTTTVMYAIKLHFPKCTRAMVVVALTTL